MSLNDDGPYWRGINHLALITTDMDATVRFYHGVLGARVVATVGTPEFRHYFFDFGPQCTVAFFEYTGSTVEPFAKAAGARSGSSSRCQPSRHCAARSNLARSAQGGQRLARVAPHGTITETVSPVWVSVRRSCTGRRQPPLASAMLRIASRASG